MKDQCAECRRTRPRPQGRGQHWGRPAYFCSKGCKGGSSTQSQPMRQVTPVSGAGHVPGPKDSFVFPNTRRGTRKSSSRVRGQAFCHPTPPVRVDASRPQTYHFCVQI